MNDFHLRLISINLFLSTVTDAGLDLSKSKRILDIGAGTGEVTSTIAKMAPNAEKIIGLDLASDYVEYAKETQTDQRIEYVIRDATEPFPDDWRFDVVSTMCIRYKQK